MVDNTLIEYCHLMQCQNAGVRPVPIIKEQQQLSNAGCGQWKYGWTLLQLYTWHADTGWTEWSYMHSQCVAARQRVCLRA